jgi:quinol monooxygenase YgiN
LKALGDEYQDVVCFWERYTEKNALRDIHAKSEGAAKLKDKISPLLADRSVNGYRQVGGFQTKNSGLTWRIRSSFT